MGPGPTFCGSPKWPGRLGFTGLGCWDVVVDSEWRTCEVLPDLSPQAGRTGLGRCHRGGELAASVPSDATQGPVQTFAGILLREA